MELRLRIPYGPEAPVDDRLDSWKGIAAYLRREVRTVQRWEKEEPLPVHRHAHRKLGSVFAYKSEIDSWSARRLIIAEAPSPGPAASRRRALHLIVPAAVLVMICAVILLRHGSPRTEEQPLVFSQLTIDTGLTFQPALSPDGRLVAYASDRGGSGALNIWLQQTSRSEPIRLTKDSADDSEPAFSPDGATVAFRSERDGGGIYAVPATGGETRKLVARGRRPRYSPDGKWLAYFEGQRRDRPGEVFVMAAAGGEPRRIEAPLGIGLHPPVWAPDSRHLLFEDCTDDTERTDWYITAVEGGPAVKTGALKLFLGKNLSPLPGLLYFEADAWLPDNHVVFAATSGDSTNLWKIRISPGDWKAVGPPIRLTSGTGMERHSSASQDGLLAFSSLVRNVDIWSIPIDPERALVTGEIERLTHDAADDISPSISADGRRMAFESLRTGKRLVWSKNLDTGQEVLLSREPSVENLPRLSPDGTKVAYTSGTTKSSLGDLYVAPFGGGQPGRICAGCGFPWSWSGDGTKLIYGDEETLRIFDLAAQRHYNALDVKGYDLGDGRFSPDGRQLIFSAAKTGEQQSSQFSVPFRDGETRSRGDWVPLQGLGGQWSPGASRSYLLKLHDGFTCLWTARADGTAVPVYHFHRARLSPVDDPAWRGGSVARDKIVVSLQELTGNIWLASRAAPSR